MGSDYANVEMQSKLISDEGDIPVPVPIPYHPTRDRLLDGSAPDYKEVVKTFSFEYPTMIFHSIEGTREGVIFYENYRT